MSSDGGGTSEQRFPGWATQSSSDWLPAESESEAGPGTPAESRVTVADTVMTGAGHAHPGRVALGAAVLVAERLRAGAPPGETVALGVGLAQQVAAEVRMLARRAAGPPSRFASRTFGWAAQRSGLAANTSPLARSRDRINQSLGTAKQRGEATLAAARCEASALLSSTVAETIAWAESHAVPQVVDGLVPHLVDSVVPRVIEGAMPEIRTRVLPVIIDDLTKDPRVRDLVMEQSQGLVGEAAHNVRSATARADDRVERAFRRLVGSGRDANAEAHPPVTPAYDPPRDE